MEHIITSSFHVNRRLCITEICSEVYRMLVSLAYSQPPQLCEHCLNAHNDADNIFVTSNGHIGTRDL